MSIPHQLIGIEQMTWESNTNFKLASVPTYRSCSWEETKGQVKEERKCSALGLSDDRQ